jgi:hypothetical protein
MRSGAPSAKAASSSTTLAFDQGAAKKAPSGSLLSTSQTDLPAIASARFDIHRGQLTANAPIGGQRTKLTSDGINIWAEKNILKVKLLWQQETIEWD